MATLKNMKSSKKKHGLRNLATITYETLQYLEDTPCRDQTAESVVEFLKAMKQFNLTRNECLMMINDPPGSALHIQIMIEDSDERLTDEQVNHILECAAKLPVVHGTSQQTEGQE
ncbi:DNA-directed RNA polymerase III subunit RPC9 isoform X2 [Aedes aegypti]|nr:DNA-directed RNA polymerase III subunit RPC9 isoform X2 [Aedes aegypti]